MPREYRMRHAAWMTLALGVIALLLPGCSHSLKIKNLDDTSE